MNTADSLIQQAAYSVAHIDEPLARLAQQVGALQGALRNVYQSMQARPAKGSGTIETWLEGQQVTVEYDYEPGQKGTWDDPELGAEVSILSVWINGAECHPDGFAPALLEKWEQAIIDSKNDAAESDRHDFAESLQDAYRESQLERAALRGGAYAAVVGEVL